MAGVKSVDPYGYRVKRGPRPKIVKMPRNTWRGSTYVESDGTELDVLWNGHRDGKLLCAPIDRSAEHRDVPAKLHLRKPS